jgi:leucyl/phenylalanyl-tRNA--protein transferase
VSSLWLDSIGAQRRHYRNLGHGRYVSPLVESAAPGYARSVPALSTEMLLNAYANGIFPMAVNKRGDIRWFSPDPRALIPLDDRFHIPHGLKRVLKKKPLDITIDQDFEGVVRACSTAHGETWISKGILRAYCELHERGFAHSVETRLDGKMVGGLYGVHLRSAFFGESMFHHATDASKVALVALVERLRAGGFLLLDTQWTTPHLERFGAFEMPREEYLQLLTKALQRESRF